jgi:hypothetical protein
MAWTIPWHLVGLIVSGDCGPLTIYTDRFGRKVPFPRSPPKEPPSPLQVTQRTKFQTAITNWKSTTAANRENWEAMSLKLSLPMTGLNAFISCSFRDDERLVETLRHQSGIALLSPPSVHT